MRIVIFFIAVLMIIACNHSNGNLNPNNKLVKESQDLPDSNAFYFPFGKEYNISNDLGIDSNLKHFYSEILYSFKEPILYSSHSSINKTLRILWMDGRKKPILIKVFKESSKAFLLTKKFANDYNGKFGTVKEDIVDLDNSIADSLFENFEKNKFLKMDSSQSKYNVKDGLLWLVEFSNNKEYILKEYVEDGKLTLINTNPSLYKIVSILKL